MKTKTKQHYDESYGSKPPQNYERYFVPTIGEPVAKDLIRKAKLRPGEKILDVACGTGIIARLALQYVGNTGTVTGTDINTGMLAVARSITSDLPIEWHEANAEEMPFPSESFDVIFCQMGLQFMKDKSSALKEMYRVLAPGGRLFLNMPGPAGEPFVILGEAMERNISPKAKEFVYDVFALNNTEEITQLISDAAFSDVDVEAKYKAIFLPAPKDFLWQYVNSTPLAGVLAEANEEAKSSLKKEVVDQWQDFVDDRGFIYEQRLVTARARK
jgi:ubiquinone/menaquinone biosynthesis C-methylase UbiE